MMTDPDPQSRAREIASQAKQLTGGARESFIREACAGDARCLDQVRQFLNDELATASIASESDNPGTAGSAMMFGSLPESEPIPERVGPYRIRHQIGRGGMGTVYVAFRDAATSGRPVAIKVVRKGVDTKDVLERFRLEQQVLSALDHPNIARFYNAGETEDGRPYFVMEHVEGQPIDAYCDANNLSVQRRLELFRKVCSAVHHAHTNLIVHRDIKPSNILVTPGGEPKLVDFGIAKLLNPGFAKVAVHTSKAMRLMTPEYASPEQVQGQPISTRSDIYSLGVLLYELLTGYRPYHLKTRIEQELIRIICETDPDRPSTVLSRITRKSEPADKPSTATSFTSLEQIAKHRSARPDELKRLLSGDLDDIILKALEKTPDRRYASAEEFALDISRHISGQPVSARRSRTPGIYHARKFVKRHKVGVTACSAILLAIIAGGAIATWQWQEAERERARADGLRDEFIDFSVTMIDDVHAKIARLPGSIEARQLLLEKAQEAYDKLQVGHDASEAERAAAARLMVNAGKYESNTMGASGGTIAKAIEYQGRALAIYEDLVADYPLSSEYKKLAGIQLYRIAELERARGNMDIALKAYEQGRDTLRAVFDHDSQAKIATIAAMNKIARIAEEQGRTDDALSQSQAAQELRERVYESEQNWRNRRTLAVGLRSIGNLNMQTGRFANGIAALEQALSLSEENVRSVPDNDSTIRDLIVSQLFLCAAYSLNDQHDLAVAAGQDAVARAEADIERDAEAGGVPDNRAAWDLSLANLFLGDALLASGDPARAMQHALVSIEVVEPLLDADPDSATYRETLRDARLLLARAALAADDTITARSAANRALDAIDKLAATDPQNVPNMRAHAVTRAVLAQSTNGTQAAAHRAQAQRLREDLESRNILDPATRRALDTL